MAVVHMSHASPINVVITAIWIDMHKYMSSSFKDLTLLYSWCLSCNNSHLIHLCCNEYVPHTDVPSLRIPRQVGLKYAVDLRTCSLFSKSRVPCSVHRSSLYSSQSISRPMCSYRYPIPSRSYTSSALPGTFTEVLCKCTMQQFRGFPSTFLPEARSTKHEVSYCGPWSVSWSGRHGP